MTYSVTDSYGNTITVKRKVTVVYTDTVPPVLFGVNDAEVFIGDPNFTPMINVSAEDNIDGDVTANITYTGEVNLWEEGEYQIAYQVSDEAGNVAEKTRTITVSLGEFSFIPVDEIEGVFDGKVVQVGETPVSHDPVYAVKSTNHITSRLSKLSLKPGLPSTKRLH